MTGRRPAERLRPVLRAGAFDAVLGQPEVSDAQVAVAVHQNVLRLQVAVDDVVRVQEAQPEQDLGRVQLAAVGAEAPLLLEPKKQLAAGHEFEDHVQLVLALERELQLAQERVVQVLQDVALGGRVRDLVALQKLCLTKCFPAKRDDYIIA